MSYGCYNFREKFQKGNLGIIHKSCDVHACGLDFLSGVSQTSAKGHGEQIRVEGVFYITSSRGANTPRKDYTFQSLVEFHHTKGIRTGSLCVTSPKISVNNVIELNALEQ